MEIRTDYVLDTLLATLFTWGVTTAGAFLVFFFKGTKRGVMDTMLGIAGGVMIAASFWSLLSPAISMAEEQGMTAWLVALIGFMLGGSLLFVCDKVFDIVQRGKSWGKATATGGGSAKRAFMLMFSITVHNIPEGLAVGVAFGSLAYGDTGAGFAAACMLALGIGLQNFPEGTAISVPLRREGFSRKKSFLFGMLSGAVEPIAGVIGAMLAMTMQGILPFMLAFAAGAMIYVVIEEIIPESQSNARKDVMAMFTLIGFSIMMVLDVALG